tara:strand:+ start:1400 stop:1780 length:381 start_codon:yes stop_codon:yes gene_type:complete
MTPTPLPTHTPLTFQSMAANMDDLKADYVAIGNNIIQNRDEIVENTDKWKEKNAFFLKHNQKYDDHWVLQRDKKINPYIHKDKDTLDAINEDIDELLIQQNTMYVSGTIACATLLVAALFVSSSSS